MSDFKDRMNAMTPSERDTMWDAYHKLSGRTWKVYCCCDCDPEYAEDDPEHPGYGQPGPAVVVVPDDQGKPDYCPRCQGYLSLDEGTAVVVTTLGAAADTTCATSESKA